MNYQNWIKEVRGAENKTEYSVGLIPFLLSIFVFVAIGLRLKIDLNKTAISDLPG